MKTSPRKLTKREREWLAHLRRAQAQRVPLVQYCRAQGLSVQSLYNLRHQLSRKRGALRGTKKSVPTGKFVAVRVAPESVPASAACRLQRKGWVIECASLPPTSWLAGLMQGEPDAVS
jgi:hypothetical protein